MNIWINFKNFKRKLILSVFIKTFVLITSCKLFKNNIYKFYAKIYFYLSLVNVLKNNIYI